MLSRCRLGNSICLLKTPAPLWLGSLLWDFLGAHHKLCQARTWDMSCLNNMDPVISPGTDTASLSCRSSFSVDGADLWRTTRLSLRPITVSIVHCRVVWHHCQCWFNGTLVRRQYPGVRKCSGNIRINHCTMLHLVWRVYWCLDKQQLPANCHGLELSSNWTSCLWTSYSWLVPGSAVHCPSQTLASQLTAS